MLGCVASGATNATAAERLGLRPETVKAYLRSAMRKLGARTRLEAVGAARRAGLLPSRPAPTARRPAHFPALGRYRAPRGVSGLLPLRLAA
ncbi:hypothetical protein RKD22_006123 [Streptomyces pristinaespiralis]